MTFDPKALERLEQDRARWESETLRPHLEKSPERTDPFTTVSGQPIRRLYGPLDVPTVDVARDLGFPGEYPFTRGVQPTMYRGRFWTMRQFSGYGSPEETNRRYKYLLQQGQMGLSDRLPSPHAHGVRLRPSHVCRRGREVWIGGGLAPGHGGAAGGAAAARSRPP